MGWVAEAEQPDRAEADDRLPPSSTAPIHDAAYAEQVAAVKQLHRDLQRWWNGNDQAMRQVWNAMPPAQRYTLFQFVKPEDPNVDDDATPYISFHDKKIPVEPDCLPLIPEFSLDNLVSSDNLLKLFDSWALPPLDIVAWESLKFVRLGLSSGARLKCKISEDREVEGEFVFILGDNFGQFARMKDDASATDVLSMQKCLRRGALCSVPEFNLTGNRLSSVFMILLSIANEFSSAFLTASALESTSSAQQFDA